MDGFLAKGTYGGALASSSSDFICERMEIRYEPLKVSLSLYKMQTNVFLLDFQRLEVRNSFIFCDENIRINCCCWLILRVTFILS
jgi:hypothetical protein